MGTLHKCLQGALSIFISSSPFNFYHIMTKERKGKNEHHQEWWMLSVGTKPELQPLWQKTKQNKKK